jgi:thiol-disulfide isomerase/thioredoxin
MKVRAFIALLFNGLLATTVSAVDGDVRLFKRGSWEEIRRAHMGQPSVVHFWGLTCGPCRVEMPQWGQLLQERTDLKLILIEADLVPNELKAVAQMLAQSGLENAEKWIFADDFVERLRFEIDPQWRGEIPRTMLIARDGSTTIIEGPAEPAEIRAWLDAQRQ